MNPVAEKIIDDELVNIGGAESWSEPTPFYETNLPIFPVDALPGWLSEFVTAEAQATQTPVDLPGMLSLAAVATACAGKVLVEVRPGFIEPVNLYVVVSLPPANRKSAVFRDLTAPIEEREAIEAKAAVPEIAKHAAAAKIEEKTLARKQEQAAKTDDPIQRQKLIDECTELAEKMAQQTEPIIPRLLADDCTPERLQTLLHNHAGRMAILSPEGDLFDVMAGRYSTGSPNLGVFLKGHCGDTLRIDRVGRPPEFVSAPTITIGITVQPDTMQGLAARPGFRGAGS